MGLIAAGAYEVVVAGGVEFMSDVPIRLSRKLRSVLLHSNKAKTLLQKIQLFSTVRPSYLALEVSCLRVIPCNIFLIHFEGNYHFVLKYEWKVPNIVCLKAMFIGRSKILL